jgi:hypothetical protein
MCIRYHRVHKPAAGCRGWIDVCVLVYGPHLEGVVALAEARVALWRGARCKGGSIAAALEGRASARDELDRDPTPGPRVPTATRAAFHFNFGAIRTSFRYRHPRRAVTQDKSSSTPRGVVDLLFGPAHNGSHCGVRRLRIWPHGLNTANTTAMSRALGETIGG